MRSRQRIALGLCLPLAALVAACGGGVDAPTINDPGFAREAERICAKDLPPLRADLSDDEPREPGEVAPTVRARADALEALVEDLRGIAVSAEARSPVDQWFSDWDLYVAVGRRYAAALVEGDPDRYSAVAEEGYEAQARISAFARANGFKSCALDGAPLPPREGL